jgi:hypothetical protein
MRAESALIVPPGLRYRAEFISESDEHAMTMALGQLPLKPFEFHGYVGNRRGLSFGLRYDYSRRGVEVAAEPPPWLEGCECELLNLLVEAPRSFGKSELTSTLQGQGLVGIRINRNSEI